MFVYMYVLDHNIKCICYYESWANQLAAHWFVCVLVSEEVDELGGYLVNAYFCLLESKTAAGLTATYGIYCLLWASHCFKSFTCKIM